MKNIFTLFILVFFLFLSSCNDSSEESSCPSNCKNCNLLYTWVSDSISYTSSSSNYNYTPTVYNQSGPNTYLYNDTFIISVEDTTICNYIIDVTHHIHTGSENSYTWYLKTWQNDTIQFGNSPFSYTGFIVLYSDVNKLIIANSRYYGS
ncbi:MAG: hypothetical protein AB7G44_17460, partial [Bacteroidia bacterium]